jgi:peptidyl-Lys metalloendopeptidase
MRWRSSAVLALLWLSPGASLAASVTVEPNCDATQKEAAIRAVNEAEKVVDLAANYLTFQVRESPGAYQTWFGEDHFEENHPIVRRNLQNIRDALLRDTIIIDCDQPSICNDASNVAGVDRLSTERRIHACAPFWKRTLAPTAAPYGTPEGTILHELSHFEDIAGTRDFPCNPVLLECQTNARSRPDEAIKNSYAYEHFCEARGWPSCRCDVGGKPGDNGALFPLAALAALVAVRSISRRRARS